MKKIVAVLDTGYDSYDQEAEILAGAGYALAFFSGGRHDREGRIAFAKNAEGIFLRWTMVDDGFLDGLPDLKAIVRYGVGYDNVDVDACTRHAVKASNVRGYASHAVSDHALALMLACSRNLKAGMADPRREFGCPPRADTLDFHDSTLGIIGFGNIGGTLCRKVRQLFGRVIAFDPYVPASRFTGLGAERVDFAGLLAGADVISLHCNLTDETYHLIDSAAFAGMSKRPILVNTARGQVVDPRALREALAGGQIHSAAVDVFPEEPPGEDWDDILDHPRMIATGHYAWYSVGAARDLQRLAAGNMRAMLMGETPADCLNPGC